MKRPEITKNEIVLFFVLLLIGTIIATLGVITLPIGDACSNFWPAIIIQAMGGLWFGWVGVLAGTIFPIFSNYFISGAMPHVLGFIPANFLQSFLPFIFYRHFKRDPLIANFQDFLFYFGFVCVIPMVIAGVFGSMSFYVSGARHFQLGSYIQDIFGWALLHFRMLLLFGLPMMIWFAPLVMEANLVQMYWSREKPDYLQRKLSLKIFSILGLITVFPLIVIGIYQMSTINKTEILRPNYLAIALNVTFFSLLLITAFLTDILARPIRLLTDKIVELSRKCALPEALLRSSDENMLYESLLRQVGDLFDKSRQLERLKGAQEVSSQVAHDIRSPLAALDSILNDISQLPEEKRIIVRSAVGRIRDIANQLIAKDWEHKTADKGPAGRAGISEPVAPHLISSLIEPLITEKRLQFRAKIGVEIEGRLEAHSYGLFAKVQPTEFKRALSNLVNNAAEALGDKGAVKVTLSAVADHVSIRIQDDGKGIPPEVLARIGQRGETHGKAGGTGLGLYHARTSAESWGGTLEIGSEVGKGTTITMNLPQAPTPDWFVSELIAIPGRPLLILDDDVSIHQVWQGRLDAIQARERGVEIVHVSTPAEIRNWVKNYEAKAREALYLLDYELLGHSETGLSLAEELGIGKQAILVTSRFEEPGILEGCQKLNVRMIPKGLAGLVPIGIENNVTTGSANRKRYDAVLIDDDPLTRMTWKMNADRAGKLFRAFSTSTDFFKNSVDIDRETPVYVDAELGNGVKGDAESLRIHEMGFSEIYLATGHEPGKFAGLTHLRGVIGKNPPWKPLA